MTCCRPASSRRAIATLSDCARGPASRLALKLALVLVVGTIGIGVDAQTLDDAISTTTAPSFRAPTAHVIGDDDRAIPGPDDDALTNATGIVSCARTVDGRSRRSRGTGTLVGSNSTILTAAHVLVDEGPAGRAIDFDAPSDCEFVQLNAGGERRLTVGFARAIVGARSGSSRAPNQDWAVLKTTEPLPDSSRPLAFAAFALDTWPDRAALPIAVVAYHADVRSRWRLPLLSEGEVFAIDYAGSKRMAHTADMGRMSSGAAIVWRSADGVNVAIGVHRSAANFGDFNLAVPIADALDRALRNLALGQVPELGQQLADRR